jgi:hypothetical protein
MKRNFSKAGAVNADANSVKVKAVIPDGPQVEPGLIDGHPPSQGGAKPRIPITTPPTPADKPASAGVDAASAMPSNSAPEEPKKSGKSGAEGTSSKTANQTPRHSGRRQVTDAKALSAKQLEANRKNSQRSTGPKSQAGKRKSAMNAYKHGNYARQLYATAEQWAFDGQDYQTLAAGILETYRPKSFMAAVSVENLATDQIRLARIIRHEQMLLASKDPFGSPRMDRILRSKNAAKKDIYRDIEELERFVSEGSVDLGQPEALESLPGNDSGEPDVQCSNSPIGPDQPVDGGANANGESVLPPGAENDSDRGDVTRQEIDAIIYHRPADLPDPPQPPAPMPSSRGEGLAQIRSLLEKGWRNESPTPLADLLERTQVTTIDPPSGDGK